MEQQDQPVMQITYRELSLKYTAQANALHAAREVIQTQQNEINQLSLPPNSIGIFLRAVGPDLADIMVRGAEMRVQVAASAGGAEIWPGQKVLLNESMNIIGVCGFAESGELGTVVEQREDGRLVIVSGADDEILVQIGGTITDEKFSAGDTVLLDAKAGLAIEIVSRDETADLLLEEVPDISYDDIGGMTDQIEQIRDSIELPYLHPELYAQYKLRPPKGVLLYGPPGCGKTLVAKAIANALAEKAGVEKSYFINIKGPELLNKWVGETERQIRLIFQRAREKASEGMPVIVFFDEMESMFRMRGSGVSSDVESTIVPQLLSEIDGVEGLRNVIVVGASNREDLIDPALLRPGRLDIKVKVDRPDADAARDIFSKYLTFDLPYAVDADNKVPVLDYLIEQVTGKMFAENEGNRFIEITYANGDKEVLYFKDLLSGAMIANIVDRAKKMAIKGKLDGARFPGISLAHLEQAVADEFSENKDLPNTTSPDDWARISGRKGEKIVGVKNLLHDASKGTSTVASNGLYL